MPRQQHNYNFGVGENRFEPSPPKMLSPKQQNHLYLPEDEYEMQPIRKNKRRERGNWFVLLYYMFCIELYVPEVYNFVIYATEPDLMAQDIQIKLRVFFS